MPTRAVLFDLFDTLVVFNVRVPLYRVGGTQRSTMPWLKDAFRAEFPDGDFEQFVNALIDVTTETVRARPPEFREVPSRVRFERALDRSGLATPGAQQHAEALSLAHMAHLASAVELPDGHAELLASFASRFRLGLVSNFDHAPTAHALLTRFGLARFFDAIVISDEFGRRKPHPAIFREGLKRVGVSAEDAIYVGDTAVDDVEGPKRVGMRAVWLNRSNRELPPGAVAPDFTIHSLPELRNVLID